MNKQRESVYTLRREMLEGKIHLDRGRDVVDTRGYLMALAEDMLDEQVERYAGKDVDAEDWDSGALQPRARARCSASTPTSSTALDSSELSASEIRDALWALALKRSTRTRKQLGPDRDPAPRRARHHAADRRRAVEGPPLQPRPPQGRHRPARLRPARSAGRVQEGKLRALPGHEGPHRGRDRPLPVAAEAGRSSDEAATPRRRRRAGAARRAAAADHAERTATAPPPSPFGAIGGSRAGVAPAAAPRPARTGGDDVGQDGASATSRRLAATIRARAAAARNTRSATGPDDVRRAARPTSQTCDAV